MDNAIPIDRIAEQLLHAQTIEEELSGCKRITTEIHITPHTPFPRRRVDAFLLFDKGRIPFQNASSMADERNRLSRSVICQP